MAATTLYSWRTATEFIHSDTPPPVTEPVIELIFNRLKDRMTPKTRHLPHPEHEVYLCQPLPASLRVLRLDDCRVRTWPQLPHGIHEFYAKACDFFTLPDLSRFTELIVIEMPDNRIERLSAPFPPNLARLNLENNALREVTCPEPPAGATISLHNNPGLNNVMRNYDMEYDAAVRRARQLEQPIPARPPLPLPVWVLAHTTRQAAWRRVDPGPGPIARLQPQRNAYQNAQNVHDSGIQSSTQANLHYLGTYRPTVLAPADLLGAIRNEIQKHAAFLATNTEMSFAHAVCSLLGMAKPNIAKTVVDELRTRMESEYAMHGYLPRDIIDRLWLRIMDFPEAQRKDVIRRFVEEVLDARGYCMNGFMVRMANVLVGYDDNIKMELNPTQILQARIPATLARLRKAGGWAEGKEPWNFWRDAILETWADLVELQVPKGDCSIWLEPLFDPIVEKLCGLRTWPSGERDTWPGMMLGVLAQSGLAQDALPDILMPIMTDYIRASEKAIVAVTQEEETEDAPLLGDKLKTE